jgi:16S rRNA (cytosine967-C5)-methyltransferase
VAVRVLFRVSTEGAWATPALDAEIQRAKLDRRDAALATEIAYGALRVLPRLDAALDAHLSRPAKVDPFLRAALRVGAYQLLHLSRVPAHAAVSDAVAIVKRERGPRLGGVANAVLRKVAASRPEAPAPPTRVEVPGWIRARLERSLGASRAALFLEARALPPPLGLRVVGGSMEAALESIREARPEASVSLARPTSRGIAAVGVGDPRALPGYAEGRIAVQELGSQLVVALVGAQSGEAVADLCAGHGTKSLALAELGAEVVAVDLYEEKLDRARAEAARLGRHGPRAMVTRTVDLSVGTGGLEARFHRVLVDAPCTGLGTLHRRPELALRVGPEDPARLAALQARILATAAKLVRPGGTLVYSVCSPTSEEGIDVVTRFEAERPDAQRLGALEGDPIEADPDGLFRIGPWTPLESAAADAYQVARWRIGR